MSGFSINAVLPGMRRKARPPPSPPGGGAAAVDEASRLVTADAQQTGYDAAEQQEVSSACRRRWSGSRLEAPCLVF